MDISVISLGKDLQELQDVMIRSYQESHVPKKHFIAKYYLAREKPERKSNKNQHFCRFILLDMKQYISINCKTVATTAPEKPGAASLPDKE